MTGTEMCLGLTVSYRFRALYTFVATKPLRALYFDGFSAAKMDRGNLDLQDVLVFGKAGHGKAEDHDGYDDLKRAELLCEWGKKLGIDGFVRQEATFELLWCDFTNGVRLVDTVNVTISPSSDYSRNLDGLITSDRASWERSLASEKEPYRATKVPKAKTIYAMQNHWSMYHATSWHHRVPDTRIYLHPSYMVSLYDPSYISLRNNTRLPVREHRLTDLSANDLAAFKDELEDAVTTWRDEEYGHLRSGIDWSAIAQAVVDRNGDRLAEMQSLLSNTSSSSNITEIIGHVRLIAYALAMPYVNVPTVLAANVSAEERSASLSSSAKRCTIAFTGHLDPLSLNLTKQEHRLKRSIESVLSRICTFSTSTLDESLTLLDTLPTRSANDWANIAHRSVLQWRRGVEDVMDWLGWSMWRRCPHTCAWDVRINASSCHYRKQLMI
jgi:hypothetical protein